MLDYLFGLPLWALAIALNLALGGFALVGQLVVRRWILPRMAVTADDSEYGGALLQSVLVLYGLVAALTAVSVWERYGEVSGTVSAEATAIGALQRDFGGYPSPVRELLRRELREYTDDIIHVSWPLQKKGQVPTKGVEYMDRLQALLFAFEPATEGQKLLHAETLRAYNHMIIARRARLDAVKSGLPTALWVVLLPGALACVALSLFFRVEDARFQAIFSVGLACFIAMVLFVIFALDRPFVGDLAIPADAYQLIHEQLMKP